MPAEDRDGAILGEEYESAIVCGNDLDPGGDRDSNGFSARGWDRDAASSALRSCLDVLGDVGAFVEELADVGGGCAAGGAGGRAKIPAAR